MEYIDAAKQHARYHGLRKAQQVIYLAGCWGVSGKAADWEAVTGMSFGTVKRHVNLMAEAGLLAPVEWKAKMTLQLELIDPIFPTEA